MQILVTGGSGFIGKHLVAGLSNDHTVFAPTHTELDLLNQPAVAEYIERHHISVVIHSAVHSATALGRDAGFVSDLRMSAIILSSLPRLEKVIFFGSGSEFGKTRDMEKISEEAWGEVIPEDPYGLTKYMTQAIISREKKIVNLRLFGIYGPHEDYRYKFISNAIVKNLLGLPIVIKQDVLFDYLYAPDLIPIVTHFLHHDAQYADYNVTPDSSITLSSIAALINQGAKVPSPVKISNPGYNYSYTGDNARLHAAIPTLHFHSYAQGIAALQKYYTERVDSLDIEAIQQDTFLANAKIK